MKTQKTSLPRRRRFLYAAIKSCGNPGKTCYNKVSKYGNKIQRRGIYV
jgi:hypothetical protein